MTYIYLHMHMYTCVYTYIYIHVHMFLPMHMDCAQTWARNLYLTNIKPYVRPGARGSSCSTNFAMLVSEKFVDLQWSAYSRRQCCIVGEKICSLVQIPFI